MTKRHALWIAAGACGLLLTYLASVPGCHSGEALLVNETGDDIDEIVLRTQDEVLWRGRLASSHGRRITFPVPAGGDSYLTILSGDGTRSSLPGPYLTTFSRIVHLWIIRDDGVDVVTFMPAPAFGIDPGSALGGALDRLDFLAVAASCPIRLVMPPIL